MSAPRPLLAIWVLERCRPGSCRDALIGDLLEEIAQGRSTIWVWQQVLAFCGFAVADHLRQHRPAPPQTIAAALSVMLFGSALLAPSSGVLEAWALIYVMSGTCTLFGDLMTRAFDSRPVLFPYDCEYRENP